MGKHNPLLCIESVISNVKIHKRTGAHFIQACAQYAGPTRHIQRVVQCPHRSPCGPAQSSEPGRCQRIHMQLADWCIHTYGHLYKEHNAMLPHFTWLASVSENSKRFEHNKYFGVVTGVQAPNESQKANQRKKNGW